MRTTASLIAAAALHAALWIAVRDVNPRVDDSAPTPTSVTVTLAGTVNPAPAASIVRTPQAGAETHTATKPTQPVIATRPVEVPSERDPNEPPKTNQAAPKPTPTPTPTTTPTPTPTPTTTTAATEAGSATATATAAPAPSGSGPPAAGSPGHASGRSPSQGSPAVDLAPVLERIRRHRRYPELARRRGVEGTVGLAFSVRADGSVDVRVVRSVDPALDAAAREAVLAAAPLPAPVGAFEVDLDFRLTDD